MRGFLKLDDSANGPAVRIDAITYYELVSEALTLYLRGGQTLRVRGPKLDSFHAAIADAPQRVNRDTSPFLKVRIGMYADSAQGLSLCAIDAFSRTSQGVILELCSGQTKQLPATLFAEIQAAIDALYGPAATIPKTPRERPIAVNGADITFAERVAGAPWNR